MIAIPLHKAKPGEPRSLMLPDCWHDVSVQQYNDLQLLAQAVGMGYSQREQMLLAMAVLTGHAAGWIGERLTEYWYRRAVGAMAFVKTPLSPKPVRSFKHRGAKYRTVRPSFWARVRAKLIRETDVRYELQERIQNEPLGKFILLEDYQLLRAEALEKLQAGDASMLAKFLSVCVIDGPGWTDPLKLSQRVDAIAETMRSLPIDTALGVVLFFCQSWMHYSQAVISSHYLLARQILYPRRPSSTKNMAGYTR